MDYEVFKSDTTKIIIKNKLINSSDTSLRLIGQGHQGYGEELNTNLIHLLENLSNNAAPSNPILGQLWLKKNTKELFVYTSADEWTEISIRDINSNIFGQLVNGEMVYGFDHSNKKVDIFSTLPGTVSEIGVLSTSGFSQGINRGLTIANYTNSGIPNFERYSRNITIRIEKPSNDVNSPIVFSTNNHGISSSGNVNNSEIYGIFKVDALVSGDEVDRIEIFSAEGGDFGDNSSINIVGYKR